MQYSVATSISTILFASTLTSALVIPRQAASTVTVQFKTGDGDSSIQQTLASGKLVTTTSTGDAIRPAVNGQIVDAGDKCQFFSDAKGANKLGGVLSSDDTDPVQFTDASDGSTASVASDAVTLGSVCCASAGQFDSLCGSLGSGSDNTGASSAFPVLIQISGLSEQATQGEIVADGKPHALEAPLIGTDALTASIVHTHKAVKCQAADANGNNLGGEFEVGTDADFGVSTGVTVATVACTA